MSLNHIKAVLSPEAQTQDEYLANLARAKTATLVAAEKYIEYGGRYHTDKSHSTDYFVGRMLAYEEILVEATGLTHKQIRDLAKEADA